MTNNKNNTPQYSRITFGENVYLNKILDDYKEIINRLYKFNENCKPVVSIQMLNAMFAMYCNLEQMLDMSAKHYGTMTK